VSVANTLVPSRTSNVPVRVLNANKVAVSLPAGTVVASLDPVTVCEVICDSNTCPPNHNVRQEALDKIVNSVDSIVSGADLVKLSNLLYEFSSAFSLSATDGGRTTVTRHAIDTVHRNL